MVKCLPCYRMKKVTGRQTGSGRGDKVTMRGPVWNRRCQETRQEQTRCKSCACVCTDFLSGFGEPWEYLGRTWMSQICVQEQSRWRQLQGGLEGLSLTGEVKGGCHSGLGELLASTGLLVVELGRDQSPGNLGKRKFEQ